jgi:hypothetical protein
MDGINGLILRPRILAAGYSDDELRRMRSSRQLVAVRPGAYVGCDDERLRSPATRHLLEIGAAVQQLGPGAVVSHASAAVLHGLPLWATPLERVHVTRNRRSGGRRSRHLHLHAAMLEPDEVVLVRGSPVTSVARTIADLARELPFEPALVPADAALFRALVTPAELHEAVERSSNRRGNTAARRVAAFADGGGQSPGETRSRVALLRAGLPPPRLQREVFSRSGQLIGRVDFDWDAYSTVGEFDGEVKYGRVLRPGQDLGEVVFQEKLREDALRDEGRKVVRWIWAELDRFHVVVDRLERAFRRG